MVQFRIFGSICKIEPAQVCYGKLTHPLYRSTERSRRSPLFLEGKLYKVEILEIKLQITPSLMGNVIELR